MKVKNLGDLGVPPKVARRVRIGPVDPKLSVPDTKSEDFFRELEAKEVKSSKKEPKEGKTKIPVKRKTKKEKTKELPSIPPQLKEEFTQEELALLKRQEALHYKRR